MDVEFHYYMTYLLAMRAHFLPKEAQRIAFACQAVDDNTICYRIADGSSKPYETAVSQTMNITKPALALFQIYPVFHFVPWCGVEDEGSRGPSPRKKGSWPKETTAPNGLLARQFMKNAFALSPSDPLRLSRIGIACHAYADTWAHQNFIGRKDPLNCVPTNEPKDYSQPTATEEINVMNIINVGHGAFAHDPDIPNLVWTDERLQTSKVNNKERFLEAAEHLFRFFWRDRNPEAAPSSLQQEIAALRDDLGQDIGSSETTQSQRIKKYCNRALTQPYGKTILPKYDKTAVSLASDDVVACCPDLKRELEKLFCEGTDGLVQIRPLDCRWKDPARYKTSPWYTFCEAIKQQQADGLAILKEQGIVPKRSA